MTPLEKTSGIRSRAALVALSLLPTFLTLMLSGADWIRVSDLPAPVGVLMVSGAQLIPALSALLLASTSAILVAVLSSKLVARVALAFSALFTLAAAWIASEIILQPAAAVARTGILAESLGVGDQIGQLALLDRVEVLPVAFFTFALLLVGAFAIAFSTALFPEKRRSSDPTAAAKDGKPNTYEHLWGEQKP